MQSEPRNATMQNVGTRPAGQNPSDQVFKTRHGGKDLKKRSVRSGAVTIGSQAAQFVLQTGATAVLARLLVPRDFGIVAMALSFTAFAQVFKDMGLSSASIQRKELTHAQVSALFWINVLAGAALTVVLAATAPLMVWFFHRPEVLWVTVALSTTFVIGSLGIQHTALLNRDMRFRDLAVIRVASLAAGLLCAIGAAFIGLRYWALVCNALVNPLVSVIMLWSYSKWRPTRPARAHGVRALFRFGANVTGFNLTNYFSRNLDAVLIGRVWGAGPLGLYTRAYALLMLPISNLRNPLNAVAYPALSHLQDQPERFRAYIRRYIAVLGFASMPIAAFLFVCSDNVIDILLGSRWIGASAIFRLLAVAAFIQPVVSIRGLVLMSTGQGRRFFWWGIWNAASLSAAFGIGVAWGPKGVALAYSIAYYVILYPSLWFAFKGTPVR
ncbi:MAG: lipopolysaccharide biosynthesis protein, partial [Verrucomicrobia bacterium]|nr:lipopolysaccharide biosynthesis protein [Verrucomicrobiota bacterium]